MFKKYVLFLLIIVCAFSYTFGQGRQVPITGNTSQLKYFFDALKEAKSKKIRVAHFGDSVIEGDVVTMEIRDILQQKFGGNGAGFISVNTEDAMMRKTTKVSFSKDWKEASIFKRNPNKWQFGINAAVFQPSAKSWAQFDASTLSKTLKSFNTARVFYTNNSDKDAQLKYSLGNSSQTVKMNIAGNKVQEYVAKGNGANWFKIEPINAENTFFYGVSLENGNGVYVDNFPIKGNSGVSLVDIPRSVLTDFNNLLNYKLIIISFGLNVLSPEYKDYSWYEKKMEKVVNYFKEAFPKTSILIVSVGDKGVKKGSKFVTDPSIKLLLQSQQNVAKNTNVAYWSLFDAMGGENSVDTWVSAKPPLVSRDFAHFTYEGGDKVAHLLTQSLLNLYNK
ncbi:MAG: hypothetical protein Q8903_02410 [Bacteroidota bacterium]|nr:hypothetical protein [Bacteroidota bacterium]